MKNIKFIGAVVALLLLLLTSSCSDEVLDKIDTDPNSPLDVPVKLLLPGVETQLAYAVVGGDMSLYASVWVQHTTGVHAQLWSADRFQYTNNMVENTWDAAYLNVLKNSNIIIEKGTEEEAWAYVGAAQVLKAYTLALITDSWGRVPYSEALKGSEIRQPKYDSQESIYTDPSTGLIKQLDIAIENLKKTSTSNPGSADLIYGGDNSLWIKAAYSLKARMITRLAKTPAYNAADVIAAADLGFSANEEGFIFTAFTSGSTSEHPWAQEKADRSHFAVSESFFNLLNGKDDPRQAMFFDEGAASVPAPNGSAQLDQAGDLYTKMYGYVKSASPMELMTYDELAFIKAEAYLRQGNTANALASYESGVTAAMTRVGVSNAAITTYKAADSVMSGLRDITLNDVYTQRYISYYPFQSVDAYADWRRTRVPALTNPNGAIPNRMPYPQGELDNNSANVPKIQLYPGTPVWWDDQTED